MDERATPLDAALAFTRASTNHDLDAASRCVAEDVVFDGPLAQTTGVERYMQRLRQLSSSSIDLEMISAHGSEDNALSMYDLHTGTYGALTCAECLTVRGGKIIHDRLTFDSSNVSEAQGTQSAR